MSTIRTTHKPQQAQLPAEALETQRQAKLPTQQTVVEAPAKREPQQTDSLTTTTVVAEPITQDGALPLGTLGKTETANARATLEKSAKLFESIFMANPDLLTAPPKGAPAGFLAWTVPQALQGVGHLPLPAAVMTDLVRLDTLAKHGDVKLPNELKQQVAQLAGMIERTFTTVPSEKLSELFNGLAKEKQQAFAQLQNTAFQVFVSARFDRSKPGRAAADDVRDLAALAAKGRVRLSPEIARRLKDLASAQEPVTDDVKALLEDLGQEGVVAWRGSWRDLKDESVTTLCSPPDSTNAHEEIIIPGPELVRFEHSLRATMPNLGDLDVASMMQIVMMLVSRDATDDVRVLLDEMKKKHAESAKIREWTAAAKRERERADVALRAEYNRRCALPPVDPESIDRELVSLEDFEKEQLLEVTGNVRRPGDGMDGMEHDSFSLDPSRNKTRYPHGYTTADGKEISSLDLMYARKLQIAPEELLALRTIWDAGEVNQARFGTFLQWLGSPDGVGLKKSPSASQSAQASAYARAHDPTARITSLCTDFALTRADYDRLHSYWLNQVSPVDQQGRFGGSFESFLQAAPPAGPGLVKGEGDSAATIGKVEAFLAPANIGGVPALDQSTENLTRLYGIGPQALQTLTDLGACFTPPKSLAQMIDDAKLVEHGTGNRKLLDDFFETKGKDISALRNPSDLYSVTANGKKISFKTVDEAREWISSQHLDFGLISRIKGDAPLDPNIFAPAKRASDFLDGLSAQLNRDAPGLGTAVDKLLKDYFEAQEAIAAFDERFKLPSMLNSGDASDNERTRDRLEKKLSKAMDALTAKIDAKPELRARVLGYVELRTAERQRVSQDTYRAGTFAIMAAGDPRYALLGAFLADAGVVPRGLWVDRLIGFPPIGSTFAHNEPMAGDVPMNRTAWETASDSYEDFQDTLTGMRQPEDAGAYGGADLDRMASLVDEYRERTGRAPLGAAGAPPLGPIAQTFKMDEGTATVLWRYYDNLNVKPETFDKFLSAPRPDGAGLSAGKDNYEALRTLLTALSTQPTFEPYSHGGKSIDQLVGDVADAAPDHVPGPYTQAERDAAKLIADVEHALSQKQQDDLDRLLRSYFRALATDSHKGVADPGSAQRRELDGYLNGITPADPKVIAYVVLRSKELARDARVNALATPPPPAPSLFPQRSPFASGVLDAETMVTVGTLRDPVTGAEIKHPTNDGWETLNVSPGWKPPLQDAWMYTPPYFADGGWHVKKMKNPRMETTPDLRPVNRDDYIAVSNGFENLCGSLVSAYGGVLYGSPNPLELEEQRALASDALSELERAHVLDTLTRTYRLSPRDASYVREFFETIPSWSREPFDRFLQTPPPRGAGLRPNQDNGSALLTAFFTAPAEGFVTSPPASDTARTQERTDAIAALTRIQQAWLHPEPTASSGETTNGSGPGASGNADFEAWLKEPEPQPHVDGLREMSLAQLDAIIEEWSTRKDTLGDLTQEMQLKLQIAMDRLSKVQTALSNAMKKISETSSAIIANLK